MTDESIAIEQPPAELQPLPLLPEDTINAAGRKIVHKELLRMLGKQNGVLENTSIEPVHKMRVSTRRMRSAMRLLEPYYLGKEIKPLSRGLRGIATELGAARDLDVLLLDLAERDPITLVDVIEIVRAEREEVQVKIAKTLKSGAYRRLVKALERFAQRQDKPKNLIQPPAPVQIRHLVPVIVHEQLAAVRGFDPLISGETAASYETLHDLRIAFKRLRYAIDFFSPVLGATTDAYIVELKIVQDHLGRLNDVVIFRTRLAERLSDSGHPLLAVLDEEAATLTASFAPVWARFNGRAVQQSLVNALLVLR